MSCFFIYINIAFMLVTLSFAGLITMDCEVDDFSAWTPCTTTCGGGTSERTRNILTPSLGGKPCPHLFEEMICNTQPCLIDCVVSEFSAWSSCSAECGEGVSERTREVINSPGPGGAACPPLIEHRKCNDHSCPFDCQVSEFSAWSSCSVKCGDGEGTMHRTRKVIRQVAHGGAPCPSLVEEKACNGQLCSTDCKVGDWMPWSTCDGTGYKERHRLVLVEPVGDGVLCPPLKEVQVCPNIFGL